MVHILDPCQWYPYFKWNVGTEKSYVHPFCGMQQSRHPWRLLEWFRVDFFHLLLQCCHAPQYPNQHGCISPYNQAGPFLWDDWHMDDPTKLEERLFVPSNVFVVDLIVWIIIGLMKHSHVISSCAWALWHNVLSKHVEHKARKYSQA